MVLIPAVTKGAIVKGNNLVDHSPTLAVLAPCEALFGHAAACPWGRFRLSLRVSPGVVFTSMPIYIGMEVKTTSSKDFHQLFRLSLKHSKVVY